MKTLPRNELSIHLRLKFHLFSHFFSYLPNKASLEISFFSKIVIFSKPWF